MMKPLAAMATVLAVATTLVSAPAWAQPQTLTPTTTTTAAEAAPIVLEDKKAVEPRKGKRWLKADARVCLEFPNDMQIIKCSEKYR